MSAAYRLPEGEWLSTDYSNGETVTFPRSTAERYVALYGAPLIPFRAATAEEIADQQAEDARIEALYNRQVGGAS